MNANWTVASLGSLGRVVTGRTPLSERPGEFGEAYPFITPSDIQASGRTTLTERFLSEEGAAALKAVLLPPKSVCVVCIGATIGKVVMTTEPSFSNQQINTIVPDERRHCAEFVFYLCRTLAGTLASCAGGAATPIINKSVFSSLQVAVPQLAEQRKIAAILSAYDDLIANNQRRIALLEGMAEEIYREWFVRRRVPAAVDEGGTGWVEKRFASMCEFRKGRTPDEISMDAAEGLSPYLSVDVLDGNDVAGWVNARKNDVLAAADDVVMLMDGARSGVVFRGAAGVVGSTAALVATAPINRPMVFEYLKAMLEIIVWNNTGSAIPHANKDFINRMVLRVPAREQVPVSFNQIYEPLFEQVQRLRQTNVVLRRTRDALLPRLISGKLKVDHLDIRLPPRMQAEAEAVA